MRHVLVLALSLAASAALAQQLPKLEPVPEPPPPPPGMRDFDDEPRVRITPQEGDRVEELRDGTRVTMLKITPPEIGRAHV